MLFLQMLFGALLPVAAQSATAGTVTQISSFDVPKSPSGLFFYSAQNLLYILCGTQTNGDHYLYAFGTDGTQKCLITIPESSSMSRVDGFYIVGSDAYIVDSQGGIYASTKLGGSVYKVDWTNPCGCDSAGSCTSSSASWSPTVTSQWLLSASDITSSEGGGADAYFRNSGIVVTADAQHFYAVNGVHPNPGLTCCYPKSLAKVKMSDKSITQSWAFTASTIGHDVDMEGLTCGADECANYIYIGDEYNYIYKLKLSETDPATAVETEWNIQSIVGNIPDDKGIESLTYAATTGYFYAGIQETAKVHVLSLTDSASPSPVPTPSPSPSPAPSPVPTPAPSPAPSPVPTTSPSPVPTPSPSPSPTTTPVPAPAPIPTSSTAPTPTATPSPTPSPVPSPTSTLSPTPSPVPTPTDIGGNIDGSLHLVAPGNCLALVFALLQFLCIE